MKQYRLVARWFLSVLGLIVLGLGLGPGITAAQAEQNMDSFTLFCPHRGANNTGSTAGTVYCNPPKWYTDNGVVNEPMDVWVWRGVKGSNGWWSYPNASEQHLGPGESTICSYNSARGTQPDYFLVVVWDRGEWWQPIVPTTPWAAWYATSTQGGVVRGLYDWPNNEQWGVYRIMIWPTGTPAFGAVLLEKGSGTLSLPVVMTKYEPACQ